MTEGGRDPEVLRRRLYRPGASAEDLADYLQVVGTAQPAAPPQHDPAPPPGSRLRPVLIGGVLVAAVALVGAVLLTGGRPARITPTAAAVVAPTPASTEYADGSWTVTFTEGVVFDGGERDHARGGSVAEGPDRVRYTISTDDTVAAVARRFQLCPADVLQAIPYGFDPKRLPAGATLELTHLGTTTC